MCIYIYIERERDVYKHMYMLDVLALAEGLLVLVVLGDLVSRRGLSAHYMPRSMWGSDYNFTDYRFTNN